MPAVLSLRRASTNLNIVKGKRFFLFLSSCFFTSFHIPQSLPAAGRRTPKSEFGTYPSNGSLTLRANVLSFVSSPKYPDLGLVRGRRSKFRSKVRHIFNKCPFMLISICYCYIFLGAETKEDLRQKRSKES
jgi:hypothetical protein